MASATIALVRMPRVVSFMVMSPVFSVPAYQTWLMNFVWR